MLDKALGVVKWFKEDEGFGFIESRAKIILFMLAQFQTTGFKSLTEGERVSFIIGQGRKGLQVEVI
ncbi:stress protein, member of the CspA-family [Legionella busanensis]|uniref:Stress protein, member of the CspA-family n=1 Tax=Legionella busanensis TaxID=190655 RepID=A0A378K988_9GAMM|nr:MULTISPECIES: cold shock domain-containing protein [Legionella]STX81508.1 stress protein, member of the CspA-family [Legionella busanensis]